MTDDLSHRHPPESCFCSVLDLHVRHEDSLCKTFIHRGLSPTRSNGRMRSTTTQIPSTAWLIAALVPTDHMQGPIPCRSCALVTAAFPRHSGPRIGLDVSEHDKQVFRLDVFVIHIPGLNHLLVPSPVVGFHVCDHSASFCGSGRELAAVCAGGQVQQCAGMVLGGRCVVAQ